MTRPALPARLGAAMRDSALLVASSVLIGAAAGAWLVHHEPRLYRAEALLAAAGGYALDGGDSAGLVARDAFGRALLEMDDPAVLDSVVERESLRVVEEGVGAPPAWASVERLALSAAEGRSLDVHFGSEAVTAEAGDASASAGYGKPLALGGIRLTVDRKPDRSSARLRIVSAEAARRALLEGLAIAPREADDLIAISFTSRSESAAPRLANAVALALEAAAARVARERARRERDELEGPLFQQDSLLAEARTRLGARRAGGPGADASPSSRDPAPVAVASAHLARRVRALEDVSDRLWRAYEETRVREALASSSLRVAKRAGGAVPLGRGGLAKILLGGLLGLGLGGMVTLYRAGGHRAFSRSEELERELDIPTLAVVPTIGHQARFPWVSRVGDLLAAGNGSRPNGSRRRASIETTNGDRAHDRGHRSRLADPPLDTPDGEAYRTLRTNLIFSGTIQSIRSLVVTSPTPGDGKTVTAANLGIAVARQGIRVLLVDADLRRPDLAAAFSLPQEPGLTDLLLGKVGISTVVRRTELAGLHVLPAGMAIDNASELLAGRRMDQALEDLGKKYDLLIVDSPPLLSASDAAVLGALADGVLVVVRAGATQRQAAREAVAQLGFVGARIVGSVLNDLDTRLANSHRYYRHPYPAEST